MTVTDSADLLLGPATLDPNGNEVIVSLTGIPDKQRVKVTLDNVNGPGGGGSVSLGFLIGDANSDRLVNAGDVSGEKTRSGQASAAANYRFDLNASGIITAADVAATKARSPSSLP